MTPGASPRFDAAGGGEVAAEVSQERLWTLLMDLAEFGATAGGGVNRQALSIEDTQAKNFVCRWAAERGLPAYQDEIGNLFVRYEGQNSALKPVMIGSHLDSQPTGGRFDGAFGVVAGMEVIEALRSAQARPLRAVEAVAWTNEEGSRFQPGAMGSSVFAGRRSVHHMREVSDGSISLGDALDRSLAETRAEHRALGSVLPHSYLEPHIEQGPILEARGLSVGVVTAVQGMRRFIIEIAGEAAHAGTAPLRSRRDALVSAVKVIAGLHEMVHDPEDITRFTIGKFELAPGSPNTVPHAAAFTIDLRHPNETALEQLTATIGAAVQARCQPCSGRATTLSAIEPTEFDPNLLALIRRTASQLGIEHTDIVSGAGHDAMHLARICPSAMVFAPCRDGVSHNESESAEPDDLAAATRVAASAVFEIGSAR